jgi:hypothetical protein
MGGQFAEKRDVAALNIGFFFKATREKTAATKQIAKALPFRSSAFNHLKDVLLAADLSIDGYEREWQDCCKYMSGDTHPSSYANVNKPRSLTRQVSVLKFSLSRRNRLPLRVTFSQQ